MAITTAAESETEPRPSMLRGWHRRLQAWTKRHPCIMINACAAGTFALCLAAVTPFIGGAELQQAATALGKIIAVMTGASAALDLAVLPILARHSPRFRLDPAHEGAPHGPPNGPRKTNRDPGPKPKPGGPTADR